MRKFLSLIVVLMLCFNVKAQSLAIATEDDSDVCTIVIEMFDSFGDGWGSDVLGYSLNGSEDEVLDFANGYSQTYTLEVSKGTHLVITYYGKNQYEENSVKISYQDGDVLYEASSEEGSPNYLHQDNWNNAVFVDTTVDCGGDNTTPEPETPGEGGENEGDGNEGNEGENEGDENENEEPVKLGIPNVVATATETTVTLTWDAVEGATSYNIYTPASFTSNVLGYTDTTYTFEELVSGVKYCFEVSAVSPTDESDTAEACATTKASGEDDGEDPENPGEDPETPVDPEDPGDEPEYPEPTTVPNAPVINVYAENSGLVVIEWEAVETAMFYYVYYEGKPFDKTILGTEVEIAVYPETTYCFTVTAVNTVGESEHSNEACATTPAEEGEEDDEENPFEPDGNIEFVENNFTICPNPASSEVKISSAMNGEANVIIYDMTGRCVKDVRVDNISNATINVSDINKGVYFINVNGKVEKLIIK